MNDLLNEKVGIDDVAKTGGAVKRIAKVGYDKAAGAVGDFANYLTKKQGYKDASTQATADKLKQLGTLDNEIAKSQIEKSTLRPAVNPVTHKEVTQNIKDLTANRADLAKAIQVKGPKGKMVDPEMPTPDKFTAAQRGTQLGVGAYGAYKGGKTALDYANAEVDNPNYVPSAPVDDELPPVGGIGKEEPKKEESMESLNTLLKLSGQKPITERDATSGLVKGAKIQNLTENTNLSECGGMMAGAPVQNASLNISASASTGDEIANMLKSIMTLAGVKPVSNDMMPQQDLLPVAGNDAMPMIKAMSIMSDEPQEVDAIDLDDLTHDTMNTDHGDGVSVAQGDVDNDGDHDANDHKAEKKQELTDEEYANTPHEEKKPGYGSWEQKFQRLSGDDMAYTPPGSGNNPLKKESVEESVEATDPVAGLFKAYEAFKNSQ